MSSELYLGDCADVMALCLPDNSVDAIVTDPPYGLSFMGKRWDYDVPSVDVWAECLRVLKPGGHLLAFAGTRTQHRMAVRIEDAGFEIRDMIAWVYGSGFPKSLDVSKAIDKVNGEPNRLHKFTEWMRTTGLSGRQINEATGTFMGSHYLTAGSQPAIPTAELWARLRPLCGDVPAWVDELVQRIEAEREVVAQQRGTMLAVAPGQENDRSATTLDVTAPATPAAQQWQGWGTALKPALEPITVARKPLAGTVAANVLEHGTGALNIDACRVPTGDGENRARPPRTQNAILGGGRGTNLTASEHNDLGRWPANLIHDGSEEVLEGFPVTKSGNIEPHHGKEKSDPSIFGMKFSTEKWSGDTGSAARFFYCAKASKRDRDEGLEGFAQKRGGAEQFDSRWKEGTGELRQPTRANTHPTVKPTDLMRYLCRLVTPPGGVVLDPFMGSGSTGKAAALEGFRFIGIERDEQYMTVARARIEHALTGGLL